MVHLLRPHRRASASDVVVVVGRLRHVAARHLSQAPPPMLLLPLPLFALVQIGGPNFHDWEYHSESTGVVGREARSWPRSLPRCHVTHALFPLIDTICWVRVLCPACAYAFVTGYCFWSVLVDRWRCALQVPPALTRQQNSPKVNFPLSITGVVLRRRGGGAYHDLARQCSRAQGA